VEFMQVVSIVGYHIIMIIPQAEFGIDACPEHCDLLCRYYDTRG
jgi:hypothetical protein